MTADDLPPVTSLTVRARLAAVDRAREAILTADRPVAALRDLAHTTSPEILAAAVRDERVRERLREPFEQVGVVLRGFAEALQPVLDAMRAAGQQLAAAGVIPEQPPTDPRERALWLRRHRSTGPGRAPATTQHRPRQHA